MKTHVHAILPLLGSQGFHLRPEPQRRGWRPVRWVVFFIHWRPCQPPPSVATNGNALFLYSVSRRVKMECGGGQRRGEVFRAGRKTNRRRDWE